MNQIWTLVIWLGILIASAIPLNLAVKMLGGHSSIGKVILANILVGIASIIIKVKFSLWGSIIAFVALLVVYMIMFRIGPIKAFFAWLLQFVIAAILIFALRFIGIYIINF